MLDTFHYFNLSLFIYIKEILLVDGICELGVEATEAKIKTHIQDLCVDLSRRLVRRLLKSTPGAELKLKLKYTQVSLNVP